MTISNLSLKENLPVESFSLKTNPPKRYNLWLKLEQIAPLAIMLGTFVMILYAMTQHSLPTLIAFYTFGISGLAMVWRSGGTSIRIFIIIYGMSSIVAVMLSFILSNEYGVPYVGGGSDELHYERKGIEFAQRLGLFDYGAIRGGIVNRDHNSVGYVYLVGLLAKFSAVFGSFHTMVPRLFNAACLALLSVVVFNMGQRLRLQKHTALIAALFVGGLPLMMWVSVQTLRDIVQTLLLVTLVFLWLPDNNSRWRYSLPVLLLMSSFIMFPIWEMRKAQALVFLVFAAFAIVTNRHSYNPLRFFFLSLPVFLISVYIIALFYSILSKDVFYILDLLKYYSDYRSGDSVGGGLSSIVFETSTFPFGWIYRSLYALISPIPLSYVPVYKAWLSLGTIIHLLFLPFLWIGIKNGMGHHSWRLIVVAFLLLFVGMSMFTFTIRHIVQYLPFGVLLTAFGIEKYQGNYKYLCLMMGGTGFIMILVYIIVKIF